LGAFANREKPQKEPSPFGVAEEKKNKNFPIMGKPTRSGMAKSPRKDYKMDLEREAGATD